MAGRTTPPGAIDPDAFLMMLDADGNILWQRSYGGALNDVFYYVTDANDGGFLALGATRSFGQGAMDYFLVKTDAAGNEQWTRTWGGADDDNPGGLIRLQDGYVISGPQSSFGATSQSVVARIDNNGNSVWERLYTHSNSCDLRVTYAENDTLFAVGRVGGAACFIKMAASDGALISTKQYDGIGSDALFSLQPTPDGNFILAETSTSPSGGDTISQWTCKFKRNGDLIWSKVFTKPGTNIRGSAIAVSDGGYLVTMLELSNFSQANPMLVKLTKGGFLEWARSYGGPGADLIFQSVQTPDGGYASVGYRTVAPGNNDIYLLKTNEFGVLDTCCSQVLELTVDNFFPVPDVFSPDTPDAPPFAAQQLQDQAGILTGADYCAANESENTGTDIELCPGQPFYLDGIAYIAPNILTDTLVSQYGCDSIVTYNLIAVPKPQATKNIELCQGDTVFINGTPYSQEGTVIVNVPSPSLCDTLVTFLIKIIPLPVRYDTFLLKPGVSVELLGNTYFAPDVVPETLPAAIGCDTILRHILLLDLSFPDSCLKAKSFVKVIGQSGVNERGGVLCASADGNFYLSGERNSESLLMKVTPNGKVLWTRLFKPVPAYKTVITDLIEDSDGMLAGCGIVHPDTTNPEAYTFRYNPFTHTLLWSKYLKNAKPRAFSMLERKPGGNFFMLVNPQLTVNADDAEIWEINRSTGAAVGALAEHYNYGGSDVWNSMVAHNGALYVVGRHIAGPLAVPADSARTRAGLSKIDTLTGLPVWSRLSFIDTLGSAIIYGTDLLIHDDAILTVSTGMDSFPVVRKSAFFLQKNTLDGDLLWLIRYTISGADNAEAHDIQRISDGYLLIGQAEFADGVWNNILVKTDFNGEVLWAKRVASGEFSPGNYFIHNHRSVVLDDALYMTGRTEEAFSDILLLKMTANGEISDTCGFVQPIDVQIQPIVNAVNYSIHVPVAQFVVQTANAPAVVTPREMTALTYCLRCCEPVVIDTFLAFCPGGSVTIGGNMYNQPGTVRDTLPGSIGCDTIVTYTLDYLDIPGVTLTVDCVDDISIGTTPGTGAVVVTYDLPLVESDCPCPGTALTLIQGLPPGAIFPVTTTKVCYEARDSCGNTATCCFNVTVREESPCDVKESGCLKYELLSISKAPGNDLRYELRVTNNCTNKMIYTTFQMPDGVVATEPPNNSVYTAPGGRTYQVRNPNYSPYYSIRYKSLTDSISNGQSDIFSYTLPGQTKPDYIHINSKLYPQVFYEVYLNTFNCPVKPEMDVKAPLANERSGSIPAGKPGLKVYPNPTNGTLYGDFSAWRGEQITLCVYNSLGQRVQQTQLTAQSEVQVIGLPESLADGLYFLEVAPENGKKSTVLFVMRNR